VVNDEPDHQVRRLREDLGIELEDLRGRWLAAEGLLTEYQSTLTQLDTSQQETQERLQERLSRIETVLTQLEVDITELSQTRSPAPVDDTLIRLQSAYEEIHCLYQRDAEEAIPDVYRRYGFENADMWAESWQRAARSPAFERKVKARVERLCP
jgi:chromosome segregation ATPase